MKFASVLMEISGRCYAGCQGCFRNSVGGERGDMSTEVFKATIRDLDESTMICGALHGESLLSTRFGLYMDMLAKRNFRVSIPLSASTMANLDSVMSPDSPVYSVLVSTDGITDHSQSVHRGNIALITVKDFVTRVFELRGDRAKPLIGVRYVENGQSEIEFEYYLRYWLRRGVDMVVKTRHFDYGSDLNSPQIAERCRVLTDGIPAVTWNGDVLLCERVPEREPYIIGNVLKDSWETMIERRDAMTHAWPNNEPCRLCSCAVVQTGFQGVVSLRKFPDVPVYMHSDSYQTFYSLRKDWTGITWDYR